MADQRIQSTEEMVGAGHATKADTLNRALLIDHNNEGKHKFATLVEQAAAPPTLADEGGFYTKDVGGQTHLFYRRESNGAEIQITSGTGLNVAASKVHGQCRLTLSGANLLLSRFGGNKLIINGTAEAIPAAGVSLAPTALAIDTNFFIYAFMSAGVMTLEASTTGHATSTAAGNEGTEIKSADETRTLVGSARTIAGPAWVDDATRIYVLSWFNPRQKRGIGQFTVERSTTSTSYVEINTEIRVNFLTWAIYLVTVILTAPTRNTASFGYTQTAIGIDGATPEAPQQTITISNVENRLPVALVVVIDKTEANHFATLLGNVSANTGAWGGTETAVERKSTVQVVVMG